MLTFSVDWFQLGALALIPFMFGYLIGRWAIKDGG